MQNEPGYFAEETPRTLEEGPLHIEFEVHRNFTLN